MPKDDPVGRSDGLPLSGSCWGAVILVIHHYRFLATEGYGVDMG